MKIRNVLLMGLVLASMILTACQPKASNLPADDLAAVKIIVDKQKEVTSEHIGLTLDLSIQATGLASDPNNPTTSMAAGFLKNFKGNVTVNGDVDSAKNDFNLSGSADIGALTAMLANGADKITFDLVKLGDKMYSRASVGSSPNTWNESNVGSSTTASSSPTPTTTQVMSQLNEIIKSSAKAVKLADESIGGVNTYHYKVTLDAVTMIDKLIALSQTDANATPPDPTQVQQAKDLLKDSVIELEMWVGQDDLYIRQESLHINLNLKNIPDNPGATAVFDFLLKATMTNVNKPVTIVVPK